MGGKGSGETQAWEYDLAVMAELYRLCDHGRIAWKADCCPYQCRVPPTRDESIAKLQVVEALRAWRRKHGLRGGT